MIHFKDNKNKSALSTRWAQMTKQEQIIEKKKMEIQAKLEAQKNAAALAAQAKLSNPAPTEEKGSPNIFSNDGSFMKQYKALLEKQSKDKHEKEEKEKQEKLKEKNEEMAKKKIEIQQKQEQSKEEDHKAGSKYTLDRRPEKQDGRNRERHRRWSDRGRNRAHSPITPVAEERKKNSDTTNIPSLMQISVMPPDDQPSNSYNNWNYRDESDSNDDYDQHRKQDFDNYGSDSGALIDETVNKEPQVPDSTDSGQINPGLMAPGIMGPGPISSGPMSFRPMGLGPMGPGPMGPGPMGPGPMGPGPMGPGPMGPGPMGPGPMGPGPMGSGPMGPGPMGPGSMGPGPMGPGPMGPMGMGLGPIGPGPMGINSMPPGPMGPGPMGPGPMGAGPMGPGPMGPGPMGPGPMGPGPMGHGPMGHGPMGHGPMGPGPMGSGPMGPGPMGPGLMGPGPMGPGPMGPGSMGLGSMGPGSMGPGPLGPGTMNSGPMNSGPVPSAMLGPGSNMPPTSNTIGTDTNAPSGQNSSSTSNMPPMPFMGGPPNFPMPPNFMGPNGPGGPGPMPPNMCPSNIRGPGPNGPMPPFFPPNGPPNSLMPPNTMGNDSNYQNTPFRPNTPNFTPNNSNNRTGSNMPFMPANSMPSLGMTESKSVDKSNAMKPPPLPPVMVKESETNSILPPPNKKVLSADTFQSTVHRAAAEVASNGDHWENVLKAMHTQDQSLWFLHNTNSNEYKIYRELVNKIRNENVGGNRNNEIKPEDKYEPEFSLEDDDSNDNIKPSKEVNMDSNYYSNYPPNQYNSTVKREASSQSDDESDSKRERRKKRKSRWGNDPPVDIKPPGIIAPLPPPLPGAKLAKIDGEGLKLSNLNRNNAALMQYAMTNYGTTSLSPEDWKKCEDNFKLNLLFQDMLKKRQEVERLNAAGKHKYEYDSDEDTADGTWEHKLRAKEMNATEKWANELTKQAAGKHHIGDFLPPEELKKFMEKYSAVKSGKEPDLSDYKEYKLREDNVGFKMLQKLGWNEGQGLGAEGTGIVEPINKANQPVANMGLGASSSDGVSPGDDEFDAYRKRMMLAYRFRPNPLNNPRRPYY